jgi:lysophospholipase L1-like esterase
MPIAVRHSRCVHHKSESASPYDPRVEALRYVALGDSYTIGTSVSEAERWPNQLVERLRPAVALELVANLGVNGYTSGDLIEDELPRLVRLDSDFATVLIGVNDVVQRVPEVVYDANVVHILDTLVAAMGPSRIVAVSTPDYTLTPRGADFGNANPQRAHIARFNGLMATRAAERAIRFVSIFSVADQVAADRSLVARDGLHPSGAQYARWVELIAPVVVEALVEPLGPSSG